MREPISLKEILAVIVKRGRGILLAALALAIVLGAYEGKKQLDLSKLPENSPQQIEAEYQVALANHEANKIALQAALKETEFALERQKNYIENSRLMKIDPYYLARSIRVLSVELTEDEELGEVPDQSEDRYTRIMTKVSNYYRTYWDVADISQVLKDYGISGIEDKYLRELIGLEISGGMISISVQAETTEESQALADAVSKLFMHLSASEMAGVYEHKLSALADTTKIEISEAVLNHQRANIENQKNREAEVGNLKNQLENLAAPERRAGYSKTEMLKNTVKWTILGAAIGGILGCGWVLVLYMFRSKVESSRQMEQVLGIPFLGSGAKRGNLFARLAERMLNERTWQDPAMAEVYMAEAFRAVAGSPEQAVILTTLSDGKLDLSMVEKAVGCTVAKVISIQDAERSAKTVMALQEVDCVLLAERVGVSEVPKMQSLLDQARRMNISVVGFVTI